MLPAAGVAVVLNAEVNAATRGAEVFVHLTSQRPGTDFHGLPCGQGAHGGARRFVVRRRVDGCWIPSDVVAGNGDADGNTHTRGGAIGGGHRDGAHLSIDFACAGGFD